MNFEADYGRFPDATTIADVRSKTHTTLELGSATSNDFFRQLIAAEGSTERIFWCKAPSTPRYPNELLGADALKKGECSFGYIPGLGSSSDLSTPVVMGPFVAGTTRFDPEAFGDKAVVLRIDGSAKREVIRTDNGEVSTGRGMTLFDPRQAFWGGKAPELKLPE